MEEQDHLASVAESAVVPQVANPANTASPEEIVRAICDLIPMDYLKARDVPGVTAPSSNLDLVGAMRDYSAARWRLIDRVKKAEAGRDALLTAMKALDECILGKAESNASGFPEWEYVSARINAARAAIRKAEGKS
jgi:hypothetical protein